jgi:hypothetical protein
MTHEVSPKTEHAVLSTLLRSGQNRLYLAGSDSFVIPLENLRAECGVARAELLEPFSAESEVTHGGFTMRYEAASDRVHFKRISAPMPATVARQPVPVEEVASIQKIDSTMSQEQVAAVARQEWQHTPSLHREFTSEATYVAFRKAEAAGRVRILGSARKQ